MLRVVKTWSENTKEGENYLKCNKYGIIVKRILNTNYYICIGIPKSTYICGDVRIIV